jgi:hypothetical protein
VAGPTPCLLSRIAEVNKSQQTVSNWSGKCNVLHDTCSKRIRSDVCCVLGMPVHCYCMHLTETVLHTERPCVNTGSKHSTTGFTLSRIQSGHACACACTHQTWNSSQQQGGSGNGHLSSQLSPSRKAVHAPCPPHTIHMQMADALLDIHSELQPIHLTNRTLCSAVAAATHTYTLFPDTHTSCKSWGDQAQAKHADHRPADTCDTSSHADSADQLFSDTSC